MDWNKEIKIPRPSLSGLRRLLNTGPQISLKRPSLGRSSSEAAAKAPSAGRSSKVPSLRAPKIKGPSLKRPAALAKGPQVQMPRLVTDLYADLRDRHLLPLVVLLIALIIAAPILLGNKSEKKPPAVSAIASSAGGEAGTSSFTVVPAARDLRSPAKRLGHRRALNPFRVDTGAAPESSDAGEAGGTSGGAEGSSTGGGNEAATAESSSAGGGGGGNSGATGASESAGAESSSPGTAAGPETGSSSSSSENLTVQVNVVGYVADIKTGDVPGELTEEKEVAPMTKLPSAKNPVVLFSGFSQGNKRALFLMTSKVTGYYGAVHCVVDSQACQMVELKPGKAAIFSYGLGKEEKRYKIVLKKIAPVVVTAEDSSTKTVEKTTHQHPAERGSAVGQARSFSK